MTQEALSRFGHHKAASLGRILPMVAAPVLGAYLGKTLGGKMMPNSPQMGEMLGMIGGTTAGRYLGEEVLSTPPSYRPMPYQDQQSIPPGAPYQLDPSSEDIPPWALMGAKFLNPSMKMGAAGGLWDTLRGAKDTILGEIPGYSAVEGYRKEGIPGAIKGTLGQAAGGVAGGTVGLGTGYLLKHLLGRDVNVPLVNIPLSHFLASVGGTIGATKGFQGSLGKTH